MLRDVAGIRSAALVRGFATVRREDFVGPGPWKILVPPDFFNYHDTPDGDPRRLYENVLVALDPVRRLNNGEPASLARWLDTLELMGGERLLHIGCGVGYYTAVAAEAVNPGGSVVAIDVDAELAERARANLRLLKQVSVNCGDGSAVEHESFDAIFVNAGVTWIPDAWLDGLRRGGRMIVPLTVGMPGYQAGMGEMLLVTRGPRGYDARFISPVGIFHCAVARSDAGEPMLQQAFAQGGSATIQSLRRDVHPADGECWLHGPRYCLSRRPCA
jgi:protein-L-isoaspartate(D-aspartate) O-methyltransferase